MGYLGKVTIKAKDIPVFTKQDFIDSCPKARHVETLEDAKERLRQAVKAYNRNRYQENKEKMKGEARAYHHKNKEKCHPRNREYKQKNLEKCNAQTLSYYYENREKCRTQQEIYRLGKKNKGL